MLRIFHVSDVHFGVADRLGEQARITDALVIAAHENGTRPDICVFSGDLAQSGESDEFKVGGEWLARLVSPWGCDLFVVPGNHDVYRKSAKPNLLRYMGQTLVNFQDAWPTLDGWPHLENFFKWHETAKKTMPIRGNWNSPFGYHYCRSDLEVPLHIIGLNSALLSCDDQDLGKLVIDIKTTNTFLRESNKDHGVIIALGHHPLDQLVDWNRDEMKTILSQSTGAHLYLHGHLHTHAGRAESDSTGRRLAILGSGAAYQGSQWAQQFAFYAIDFETAEFQTTAYTYSKNAGKWVEDPTKSMAFPVNIPRVKRESQRTQLSPTAAPITIVAGLDTRPPVEAQLPAEPQLERLENEAFKYREAAVRVQEKVVQYVRESENIRRVSYTSTTRIKNIRRIVEKVRKNNLHSVSTLNDICGIRIITYFLDDIPSVVEDILRHADTEGPISSPFKRGGAVDIRIHTSRHENDPLSITKAVKEVAKRSRLKPSVNERSSETNYSSVHLILWAPIQPEAVHDIREMRLEIQVRCAPEELWGAIDHRLRYGSERGGTGVLWQRHLNVLKALVDALMQYVDEIKRLSEEGRVTPPGEIKEVRSIGEPSTELNRLQGLPPEILAKVVSAYEMWTRADASISSGGDPGLFRQAADAFAAILREFSGESGIDHVLSDELIYVAQAEQAYMLMYTGDSEDLANSAALYDKILAKNRDDGTALFRLGEVKRRQYLYSPEPRTLEDSTNLLRRALEVAERGEDKRVKVTNWTYDSVRLALALTSWRTFEDRQRSEAERQQALSAALELSRAVLDKPAEPNARTRLRALNDFLYYSWEERDKFGTKTVEDEIFSQLAEELKRGVEGKIYRYEYIDTLQRAFRYLERAEDMRTYALKIRDSLEQLVLVQRPNTKLPVERDSFNWTMSLARYLDLDQQDALAFAQDILNPPPKIA